MTSSETDEIPVCDWRKWHEAELVALYNKESTVAFSKFDKKAIKLVQEMTDYAYRQRPIFNGKKATARRKVKAKSHLEAVLEIVGETEQEKLYSSDTAIGSLLKGMEKGDTLVSPASSKAFVNPNKSIAGIKYTRVVAVIHGVNHALPVPYRLTGIETMYLIPVGTEFIVEDITKETWKCQPLISCPSEYQNISVYHLRIVD